MASIIRRKVEKSAKSPQTCFTRRRTDRKKRAITRSISWLEKSNKINPPRCAHPLHLRYLAVPCESFTPTIPNQHTFFLNALLLLLPFFHVPRARTLGGPAQIRLLRAYVICYLPIRCNSIRKKKGNMLVSSAACALHGKLALVETVAVRRAARNRTAVILIDYWRVRHLPS